MATVSLQMIVKDEGEAVSRLIADALPYFTAVNLTVSDKKTANKLKKAAETFNIMAPKGRSVNVKYREWNDRFDEARNANLAMCKTDYFFWLDADDSFPFAEIPRLVAYAEKENVDTIFLPYNYAQDEQGNCVTRHWRERLLKNSGNWEWRGWVHETCISDEPYTSHKIPLEVKHNCDLTHAKASVERNHAILEKAYAETKDPRYLHYLGMSCFTHQDYPRAIELLDEYLQVGGSVEDSYRALGAISEAAYHMKQFDVAMEYATRCATLKPEYPQAYWQLAQYEADQGNWFEALEWVRVSETKPDPQTLSVWDPSARERAILIAAQAYFMLGEYTLALKQLQRIPKNSTAQDLMLDFRKEAAFQEFIGIFPSLRPYFADDEHLYDALASDVKYDKRLLPFRQMVTKPKTWGDKSIVIFCGRGYEEWGPHTLDKGMGGSEEAVVYLARELVKLGYEVTVFAEASMIDPVDLPYSVGSLKGISQTNVIYRHWQEIDVRDEFNIFVAWRAPQYLEKINAKVKIADIHDVLPESVMKDYPDVTYMVKTAYHRSLTPNLPDDKFCVVGNGIRKDQFRENS